ncbi:beta-phosphoglucomutase family hydrolase [Pontibacter sp. CAU 1760]
MPPNRLLQLLKERNIQALILDMDGVITQTARLHAAAWKKMFDAYLRQRGQQDAKNYAPLEIATDYRQHIDGIPRYDGVRNFLQSRGILLPEGTAADTPDMETVAGLGNRKNEFFQELMQAQGVEVYPDTLAFLKKRKAEGYRLAVISASKNCRSILAAAGVADMFEVRVDGQVAVERNLKGKPAPDVFIEAARQLGVPVGKTAIFEDAISGVQAGRAGGFALVVGIDRTNQEKELIENGAELALQQFPTD